MVVIAWLVALAAHAAPEPDATAYIGGQHGFLAVNDPLAPSVERMWGGVAGFTVDPVHHPIGWRLELGMIRADLPDALSDRHPDLTAGIAFEAAAGAVLREPGKVTGPHLDLLGVVQVPFAGWWPYLHHVTLEVAFGPGWRVRVGPKTLLGLNLRTRTLDGQVKPGGAAVPLQLTLTVASSLKEEAP